MPIFAFPNPLSAAGAENDLSEDVESTAPDDLYTIAYSKQSDFLLACVPRGQDLYRAVERQFKKAPRSAPAPSDIVVVESLTLTNDETLGDVVYGMCPNDRVWLKDSQGNQYAYAVKLNPPS